MRYKLNSPDVIHETVDEEALVIHTPGGVYFSMQGTAERVWNALVAGHSPTEIGAAYAPVGQPPSAAVIAAVETFVQELLQEQLIIPGEHAGLDVLAPVSQPFSPPIVQKFTDMQELLLVDPIHEVDPQAGWPQRRDTE